MNKNQPDPSKIIQTAMGFWPSKVLLSAVNMELFTVLARGALSAAQIKEELSLHDRSLYDFLDTLVALGFLERSGIKESAIYSNTPDCDLFLDKEKPTYMGGLLEMANNRLYPFWNNLEEGLKTGKPQNEIKDSNAPVFETLYTDKARLKEFVKAMAGFQMGNFIAFSKAFDFSAYKTLCDLGGAGGHLSAQVAINNEHMRCITYDLAAVAPVAQENIDAMGLSEKVSVRSGDFFTDEIPGADVIVMGNILHDWGTEDKKKLIKKVYNALPEGGALAVIEKYH